MHYLYDSIIDFDAKTAYEAKDIEGLIAQIQTTLTQNQTKSPVVVLKNAHYLTTKAFAILNDYIRSSQNIASLIIVSSDRSKIFPPLLEYIESAHAA